MRSARRGGYKAGMTSDTQPAGGHARAQDAATIPLVAADYSSSTLLLDEMLADLVSSGEFLVDACELLDIRPRQVYRRLGREVEFAALMDDARTAGMAVRASRTARIARGDLSAGSSGDWKRDQLIVKQENWLLEKLHPEQYGAKLEVKSKAVQASVTISDDPIEAARQYAEWVQKT